MAYAPCQNKSCKSFGKPHPNCRCYGQMADGGEAGFCNEDRAHDGNCEYFAEGGPVQFDDLHEDVPEAAAPQESSEPLDRFDDLKEDEPAQAQVMFDDLKEDLDDSNNDLSPADLQKKMVAAANPDGQSKYETPGQQALTMVEGAAQGLAGPLATMGELGLSKLGVPGITAEDQKARQEANPVEHGVAEAGALAASLATGVGAAGAIARGLTEVGEFARLGAKGSQILKGALTNFMIATGDETSKVLLGQDDPERGASYFLAHLGLPTLIGGAAGAFGSTVQKSAEKALSKAAEAKIGDRAVNILAGIAAEANPAAEGAIFSGGASDLAGFNPKMFKLGKEFTKKVVNSATSVLPAIGGASHGVEGLAYGQIVKFIARAISEPLNTKISEKVAGPVALRVLSSGNTRGIVEALNYGAKVAKGAQMMTSAIDDMFLGSAVMSEQLINNYEKIEKWVEGGGVDQELKDEMSQGNTPQGFAEGGAVQAGNVGPVHTETNGVAIHYPEQNIALNAAKTRVSNYLKGLKPQAHAPKLAFDDEPDNREQHKSYKRAIAIADKPLSVLHEIANGTIEPEHIKHLTAMYPEVAGQMQKQITKKIIQAQLDGKKPPYKVRQGMSLLMGAALSSDLSPANIQAAQATFARAKQEKEAAKEQTTKKPKGLPSLTKSDDAYLTSTQARVSRSQSAR